MWFFFFFWFELFTVVVFFFPRPVLFAHWKIERGGKNAWERVEANICHSTVRSRARFTPKEIASGRAKPKTMGRKHGKTARRIGK